MSLIVLKYEYRSGIWSQDWKELFVTKKNFWQLVLIEKSW